jgi:hypothetical protein
MVAAPSGGADGAARGTGAGAKTAAGPGPTRAPTAGAIAVAGGAVRPVLVGELCPDKGGGRAAILVLAARQVGWTVDADVLDGLVRRGGERAWAVLGYRGNRAGVFSALGAVDLGTALPTVTGGFAGHSVCDDGHGGTLKDCGAAQAGCGVAVASLLPDGGDEAPAVATGDACVDAGTLWIDIDSDGQREGFAAAAFLDELKAPADEVAAKAGAGAPEACAAAFAWSNLVTGRDPKAFRALDLVAVADLDDDGRREIVVQYRYGTVRTLAIYAAPQTSSRLVLAAEVAPWAGE